MTEPWRDKRVIGDATLYLGRCEDVLPAVTADACVTDPPYGIAYSPAGGGRGIGNGRYQKTFTGKDLVAGDDQPFDPAPLLGYHEIILWGANHYADRLPSAPFWLVWDKRLAPSTLDFADCEMAWTNIPGVARVFRHLWNGMMRDSERDQKRVHPTQKPIALMEWCLAFTQGQTVLDPFMGSGTTGVACAHRGRSFVGIEIEPRYYEIACRRIEEAQRQGRLFDAPKPKAEQLTLDGA